ncbi:MAG TPA: flagellar assembly protein FliX [Alphaproteobacteria bacterium]|nr:flagellar assembly protein FliX [Alphaproteobacteria bacterium]
MSINKVEGPGGVRGTAPTRKTGKAGSVQGSSFSQHLEDDGTSPVSGVSSLGAVGGISAILGVQEVGDATERAARGKKRGSMLLEQLDELRVALITGSLSKEQLIRLSRMVQSERAGVDDPHLAAILDEIDLRARVELAKYGF